MESYLDSWVFFIEYIILLHYNFFSLVYINLFSVLHSPPKTIHWKVSIAILP